MLWHASDHRKPSSVKWFWIAARGQWEDRATRLLDQSGWAVLAGPIHCSGSRAGGYHSPGQPLATCSSLRPAWIITFHSVIFHHGSLRTDNWAWREAPRSGVPPDALRKRESEGERERESLHSPLKRTEEDGQKHIVRGFKKGAYGCYEKRNVLLEGEKNESACWCTLNEMYASGAIEKKQELKGMESEANDTRVFWK